MPKETRFVRVRALAKINLNLEVLHRRDDGYHELRTVFQTISLHDTLDISYCPGRGVKLITQSNPEIPGNLVTRAAELILAKARLRGEVRIALHKRTPMGAGLGGGSSDAAAVLLALPALTGRPVPWEALLEMASALGSDVPFFLIGGCALGLGRGEQLYPIKGPDAAAGLIVDPKVHVSTANAYRALARPSSPMGKPNTTLSLALGMAEGQGARGENDFEAVVFREHPRLRSIKRKLVKLGAAYAMLSGSGASIFAIFDSREQRDHAREHMGANAIPVSLVSLPAYRRLWRRSLIAHITSDESWPPRSLYAR